MVNQQHTMVSMTEKSSDVKIAVNVANENLTETKPMQRRTSARIQAVKEKTSRQKEEAVAEGDEGKTSGSAAAEKPKRRYNKRSRKEENVAVGEGNNTVLELKNETVVDGDVISEQQKKTKGNAKCEAMMKIKDERENKMDFENADNVIKPEKTDSLKVKETIRLFTKHYLHFVQEEEKRCAKAEADRKAAKAAKKASKSNKTAPPEEIKNTAKRPDLKAITKMIQNNEILNPEKKVGTISGIEVGHQFYSRAEMVVVGFHSHWLNGIDFMGQSYAKVHKNYEYPVAVAIVLSGMYEDDLDNAEDVVYTGQGGHNLIGDKRQIRDQKLERGNLALKNCVEQCVPVRVVRGHESSSSYTGKIYTYDGLYKVVNYWAEKGISGFIVYKFRLRRLEGQPLLTTNQVYFTCGRVPQSVAEIRGLVCEDITEGQEDMPIPATNLVDDPPVPPTGFTYSKSIKVAKNVKLPMDATGCKCKDKCVDPTTCECALRNGSDFPYVSRDGGRLIEAKDVVFECGPNCGCGPGCVNRTSQRGLRYRLEVFRTAKKGWAVRSWDFIPSGAPVCEYTGILSRAEDMETVLENNYIFEIDCLQTIKGIGGREKRSTNAAFLENLLDKSDEKGSENAPEYCLDAGSTGNIARFINHCCEPNLFVQCVLSTHHDLKFARVMLFAADNIPPMQELTYDYGYALDSVLGSDGKIKQMPCYCGATGCRKRLF
ncbi:PREDICTED: histone-lysine N-methyltransferase, H3 lysine-9 specific SUVH4 [Lupinus angustifolius]|uniref:histone-lysine N-methyltransferase, H3 lysine-9 specific SUVH4 n=1 Tax=Lupinus angustifolius TaxID=3871 RepID=UPI00092E9177|nr:PREDICTED: histone-lysine N-methyltransferase, H3 lysine-9 specific SUVH4 [Lupinus angustifolius]